MVYVAADSQDISIHAFREEGDSKSCAGIAPSGYFYPRPPRGGRPHDVVFVGERNFISIHALREEGDHRCRRRYSDRYRISIHALREEGDLELAALGSPLEPISIHALCEEGDVGVETSTALAL